MTLGCPEQPKVSLNRNHNRNRVSDWTGFYVVSSLNDYGVRFPIDMKVPALGWVEGEEGGEEEDEEKSGGRPASEQVGQLRSQMPPLWMLMILNYESGSKCHQHQLNLQHSLLIIQFQRLD